MPKGKYACLEEKLENLKQEHMKDNLLIGVKLKLY